MAQETQFTSDKTGGLEKMRGSDGRANVSSRQDSRGYYNSRDESEAFSLAWDDASSAAGDFIIYWKNTDTTGRQLVIRWVNVNSELASSFKLHVVTGTAAAGSTITPFCLNRASPKTAAATAMEAAGTPITGLSSSGVVSHASVGVDGREQMNLDDMLRIGQDGAIAVEFEQGSTSRTWGVIFGYYE